MEVKQMIMMTIMLLMTGGMAYLIGDFHGFLRVCIFTSFSIFSKYEEKNTAHHAA